MLVGMRCSPSLLAAVVLAISIQAADIKPNVLFIAIDDQNDWFGYLGGHTMA